MTTTNHILGPLVNQLLMLDHSIKIKTHCHPEGRKVMVRLSYLSGDIVANHKVAGFISHSGNLFSAYNWKNSDTLIEQNIKLKRTGVRWSELNRLPYWDPIKHIVLGVMHNWFKEVLANHFHF
ncbi:hypothetical protein CROQUDRAFT_53896 [Cronartium quercuum f. sp. fusiforme G11]|uniref:Uncharacterized protein n=1 Tax=Cronartium quercuum f. sp. fusiforme G11 TaxID=708437 RepID=A0A9P6N5X9_9BASI|nr:hypothetical protein CROQUDRAFT_53896 [Cronartium quercuum f. sp. fusiforme G11]